MVLCTFIPAMGSLPSFNTQGGGEVTKQYVDIQDAATLNDAKGYTDDSLSSFLTNITSYIDSHDTSTYNSAKNYADLQDAETLQAAKDYTDTHSGQGGVSQQYVDDHDAATLQDAKDYADGVAGTAAGGVQDNLDTLQNSLATVAFTGDYDDLVGQPDYPVITMTDTDPGEGVPLAENHFIAVYQGGNQ